MNVYFHVFFVVCCVAIIHLFSIFRYIWDGKSSDSALLVIGILSARENFELREAARSSWLKYYKPYKNNNVKAWFIIGKTDCKIPPEYRLSRYSCEKWNLSAAGISSNVFASQEIQNDDHVSKKIFSQGFSFKVNHPVIIKKLGILSSLLLPNAETNVAILDIQSKEILVQTTIIKNSSFQENGFLYKNIEPILLPKHYEGMLLVEGYLQKEAFVNLSWNDGGGIITFNRIYLTSSHLDSIEFRSDIYSAANLQFYIHDLDLLKKIMFEERNITSNWQTHIENVNKKLMKENAEKQDILFVDVLDTYRNLPLKLLEFYKWIEQNYKFSFLMKADDDTVVNTDYLIAYMKSHPLFKPYDPWIWSRFRKDWPVNYLGKWADYDYRSSIYPAFPCGATYILSHKTVQWLSLNANSLFPYQGEDVSMGIWLSAIKPDFINDDHFECDSSCSKESYNRAQLTAPQIYEVGSKYETCQNICSCD